MSYAPHHAGLPLTPNRSQSSVVRQYLRSSHAGKVLPEVGVSQEDAFDFGIAMLKTGQASAVELPLEDSRLPAPARPPDGRLTALLDQHGSNKGTEHGYGEVYQEWASSGARCGVVVEVGLGSPSGLTPSNMGPGARPGASLRAWADFFPHAAILGGDVDTRAFPPEPHPRIECFQVNQVRPPSFTALLSRVRALGGFDLGVVDGLHTTEAEINSLLVLLPWLRPEGLLCIEDLTGDAATLRGWSQVLEALPDPWHGKVQRMTHLHMVIVTRQEA